MTPKNNLPVGRIAGLFGLRGELKCDPTTAGRTVISRGAHVTSVLDACTELMRITTVREHKGRLLLTFEGVDDATAAQRYVGAVLHAERDAIVLEPGEFLDVDLIGCTVRGLDGAMHGTVERVEHYPAQDMLVVAGHMIPMVSAFIRSINTTTRSIEVDLPPGLLDL